jgi:hypothetical protein
MRRETTPPKRGSTARDVVKSNDATIPANGPTPLSARDEFSLVSQIRCRMSRSWRARTPRPIWFNDAHEAEAKEAQLRKPPSWLGTWILRRLGFRGEIGERAPHAPTRHSHEHPVHRPPGT